MRAKFKVSFQSGDRLGAHHSSEDISDDSEGLQLLSSASLCKLDADMVPVALMASESGSHAVKYTLGPELSNSEFFSDSADETVHTA